jgi:uncharacterized membrane protein YidH (DUF202 family)
MVYVRRVIGLLLIVFGLMFVFAMADEWNRVDAHGNRLVSGYVSLLIASTGSGIAILWPIKDAQARTWKSRAAVYARRVLATLFISWAVMFAIKAPSNWERKRHNHNVGAVDIAMVVLFSGLATAVLWPPRRENRPGDSATS